MAYFLSKDEDDEKYSFQRFVKARSFRLGLVISLIVIVLIVVALVTTTIVLGKLSAVTPSPSSPSQHLPPQSLPHSLHNPPPPPPPLTSPDCSRWKIYSVPVSHRNSTQLCGHMVSMCVAFGWREGGKRNWSVRIADLRTVIDLCCR